MHLILVISSLGTGGAQRALSYLANNFISKGYKVTLITIDSHESKPFYKLNSNIDLIQINQVNVGNFLLTRPFNIVKRIIKLRNTVKGINPNVIISFIDIINMTTLLATVGLKIPVIISERTNPHFHPIPLLYKKIRPIIYKLANKIVVQTESASSYFKKNLQSKIQIIPNVVKHAIKRKKIKKEFKSIITIGRLDLNKNQACLIKAFNNISDLYPYVSIYIYGEGTEFGNLQNLINTLNLGKKVFLLGDTDKIYKKLLGADLFVFTSLYEGFPNALCEAMSVGLPVIASNCSGNVDIIIDKFNGRIFPSNNIEKLSEIIAELIDDYSQRKFLGENASKISQKYNHEQIFWMWDKLILESIKNINFIH